MNPQTLINKETVPPGGFRFLDPYTGVWIHAASFDELETNVKKHRKANNNPIGLMLREEIETQLCESMPPGVCSYANQTQHLRAIQIARPSIHQVNEATPALISRWFKHGLVSQEQAERHAKVCLGCVFNQPADGCSSCNSAATSLVIRSLFGTLLRSTPYDSKLTTCLLCKCHLKAKVWCHPEAIREGSDITELLPPHCWILERKTE